MKSSLVRRSGMSVATATFLSLLLAGQAMAASWSSPTTIWSSDVDTFAWPAGLVTLDSSTALAVYQETYPTSEDSPHRVFLRRSTDSGLSWAPRVRLSRAGSTYSGQPSMAALGKDVDVVWTERNSSTGKSHIRYTRSTDAGASFASSVALSPLGSAASAKVARGPNGRVAVLWQNEATNRTLIRVSTNGGASFGARKVVVPSVSRHLAVAVGDGVIYVAYSFWANGIWLRRSLDDGASWSAATKLTAGKTGRRGVTLTAEGAVAYLGFARKTREYTGGWTPSFRRTLDKGASWSGQVHLAMPSANAQPPLIALQGGIARAAFARCQNRGCDLRVFYRQSPDGLDWTPSERLSPAGSATPFGVGFTGGKIVIGYDLHDSAPDTSTPGIWHWPNRFEVRTGTP